MPVDTNIPLALQWNRHALEAIKYTRTPMPMAARALAMVHTAMYNAWSVYNKKAVSTNTAFYCKIKEGYTATKRHKQKAFSYAAYRVLTELFRLSLPAERKNNFRDLMMELDYDPEDTSLDPSLAQGTGNLAAKLVMEFHAGDGSNPFGTLHNAYWSDYTGYTSMNEWDKVNEPDHWQPLRIKNSNGNFIIQQFLVPHWGLVRSFSMNDNGQFRPPPPYYKSHSRFKEQAKRMLSFSTKLTDEQKIIAEYWADGLAADTLATRWCDVARFVATTKRYENDDCIKLFFALGNSLLDASIACWECKRHYDAARPVTVIHGLYKGREIEAWDSSNNNTYTIKGEEWGSYIPTPPFPEYVSLQSTASRAAAMILQRYTGSNQFRGFTVIEQGDSQIEKGISPKKDIRLDWVTFTEAADEAGRAGLYGGIHFERSIEEGKILGEAVGECVWRKALFYFND